MATYGYTGTGTSTYIIEPSRFVVIEYTPPEDIVLESISVYAKAGGGTTYWRGGLWLKSDSVLRSPVVTTSQSSISSTSYAWRTLTYNDPILSDGTTYYIGICANDSVGIYFYTRYTSGGTYYGTAAGTYPYMELGNVNSSSYKYSLYFTYRTGPEGISKINSISSNSIEKVNTKSYPNITSVNNVE